MTADPSSRHHGSPTYRVSRDVVPPESDLPGIELYVPRVRTRTPATRQHQAARTDRPDLLAAAYLGDPHLYWRIADANPGVPLDELCEPGRTIDIPGPGS